MTEASSSLSADKDDEERKIREKIDNDLKIWEERFAKAADQGTEDLEERLQEITQRQVEKQVRGVGDAMVIELEELVASEIAKVRKTIKKIVKGLAEEISEDEEKRAEDEMSQAVRNAGLAIRTKAQALRTWKQQCIAETQSLVTKASNSTLEVIDSIRDLGLQEIGMRWAWTEGVTYKDWSNFHEVRKTWDEWRDEIEAVATSHQGLADAKSAAEEVESKGLAIAGDAGQELARLKDVGRWKIRVKDDTDDFSSKVLPPRAAVVGQKVRNNVNSAKDAIMGTSQDMAGSIVAQASDVAGQAASGASSVILGEQPSMHESMNVAGKSQSVVSAASKKAEQASQQASSVIIGSSTPVYESAASEASKSIESVASQTSAKVYGGAMAQKVEERITIYEEVIDEDDDNSYTEKVQSIVNQAGDKYADATRAVSEALYPATKTQSSVESIRSVANEHYSSALEAASKVLYGEPQGTGESISGVASSRYAQAVSA